MASNPFVLPASSPVQHTQQDIVDSLNAIFTNFNPASHEYSMYFQLMPVSQGVADLQGLLSGALNAPGGQILERIYQVADAGIGIRGKVLPNLANRDVFEAAQPAGSNSGPQSSVFIVLDGFNNTPVPIEVACMMEANFIEGFATRLILGQFKKFWDAHPDAAGTPGYALNQPFNINLGAVTANQATLTKFSDPATYPPYHVILGQKNGIPSYSDDLSTVLAQNPITAIGMLYGWLAAEQLEHADAQNPAPLLVNHAFRLLGFRFSIRDLGEMTAFTLNYLNGAAENESIQSIINGGQPVRPPDVLAILEALGSDDSINAAKDFLIGFENVLVAEFYALSQNSEPGLANKLSLLSDYFNFIEGFHEGIAKSADAHYKETFELGFGLGYNSGFTDGYALGYANGYADGFAAGNAAAWRAANQIISGLQDQITKLQTQLAQVQAAQNGGGSGGGFWNTVGKIGGAIETAVGVISTLTKVVGGIAGGAAGAGGAGAAGAGGAGAAGAGGVVV